MKEEVILTRRVVAQGWRAVGQIATAVRRKELEPVLLRAREAGGTDAEDVARHLLFAQSRKTVAERLLRIGAALGLLEEHRREYALTESGERAIAAGKVFVPEHGAWTVWASDDPLLPSPVLHIEAADEPDAVAESRNGKERRSFEPLPDWIRGIEGAEIVPPATGDGIAIRIDGLEKEAEAVEVDASLHLIWNVRERRLRLHGTRVGHKVDFEVEAHEAVPDRIWDALLDCEGLSNDWDRRRCVLRTPFGQTTERERESMLRDVEFHEPIVPGYGKFDPLTVPDVAITARSREDAQQWSLWRLNTRIRDYATVQRYDEWSRDAVAPFVEYVPELPSRSALAQAAWVSASGRSDARTWHLVAAEDWGL